MLTRPGEINTDSGSATNGAVAITIPASATKRSHVSKVIFSYSATPTNGGLTVAVNGTTKLDLPITAAGPGPLNLNIPGEVNTTTVITLAAGGSGIVGKLYVEYFQQ